MRRAVKVALTVAVAAAALAAGGYVGLTRYAADAPPGGAPAALARIALPDLAGKQVALASWQGKVLVVNFWATWCTPCRREIPGLISVQGKYAANGLQIVGIAVDQADKARTYAKKIGINYPILVAGMEGASLSRELGNRTGALPFTLVVDRAGKVVKTHLGLITAGELEKLVDPLLADAAKSG
jgi:thiol-disulfide isomerase/thioredoxin